MFVSNLLVSPPLLELELLLSLTPSPLPHFSFMRSPFRVLLFQHHLSHFLPFVDTHMLSSVPLISFVQGKVVVIRSPCVMF